MASDDAFAFGAMQAIESGKWDRYLHLLIFAIRRRQGKIK
jgi:hypothetical protein